MQKKKDNTSIILYGFTRIVLVIFTLLSLNFFCYSQLTEITGTVKDSSNAPVINATITLTNDSGRVLFYTFSNNEGFFRFLLTDKTKTDEVAFVEIASMGYKKQKLEVGLQKTIYDFILTTEYKQLKEIRVSGSQRVKVSNDTTTYNVSAFSSKEDYSIGDVVSRLPGMAVTEEGKIKYLDKEIAGLYIQGDNLFESNYGIGTKSIPKEMIKSIQVIERFQPVRVLKDKVITKDVAVNLVLKNPDALKFSGMVSAGVGIKNIVHTEGTVMLFNKKIKTLNLVNYNNDGETFTNQYIGNILSDAATENPGVPGKYINNNRSSLAGTNYLYNLKDTIQLKVNFQYSSDKNLLDYSSYNKIYTANDTFVYNEYQNVTRRPSSLYTTLSLEQNKQSRYVKDILTIKLNGHKSTSEFSFNESSLNQNFKIRNNEIENNFEWLPYTRSKNVYSFSWIVNYKDVPQHLSIQPGLDSIELNEGIAYDKVVQALTQKELKSGFTFNYYFNDKKLLKKSIKVGILNDFQHLNSRISLWQTDGTNNYFTGDNGNALSWQDHKEYIAGGLTINTPDFKFNFSFPVTFRQVMYKDETYLLNTKKSYFFLNPILWTAYSLTPQNSLNFTYSYNNDIGTVGNIYRGLVLTNFKELKNNHTELIEANRHFVNLQYLFKNPIQFIDFSLGSNYSYVITNSIYSTIYENNITRTVLLPYRNNTSTIQYDAILSKYFLRLKSKFEIGTSYSKSRVNLFANNNFLPYINYNLKMRITGGFNLSDFISLYYSGVVNWFKSKSKDKSENSLNENDKIKIYNHTFSMVIFPKIPLNITLQAQQQTNISHSQPDNKYIFFDCKAKYKISKLHTELELTANNLFNVTRFGTNYLAANQYFSSDYQLRGRMILIKVNFIF